MKTILIILLSLFVLLPDKTSEAQNSTTDKTEVFKPGEVLLYQMSYGWIVGGKASLSLKKATFQGKDAYHVKAIGKTVGVAHSIFNVRDVYESYFDPITCKPFKSTMDLKEGKYRNSNEVYYNHANRTLKSKKSGEKKIEKENIYDIVSAFYQFRKSLDDLNLNDKVVINTYFHDEPWDLVVRFKGYETIKVGLGKIKCMKFKPIVEEGTFESEDALDIWISADKNRIPIRVQMKFFVGSFKTDLIGYTGLVHDITFTKK